jgi:hypothetical protein
MKELSLLESVKESDERGSGETRRGECDEHVKGVMRT